MQNQMINDLDYLVIHDEMRAVCSAREWLAACATELAQDVAYGAHAEGRSCAPLVSALRERMLRRGLGKVEAGLLGSLDALAVACASIPAASRFMIVDVGIEASRQLVGVYEALVRRFGGVGMFSRGIVSGSRLYWGAMRAAAEHLRWLSFAHRSADQGVRRLLSETYRRAGVVGVYGARHAEPHGRDNNATVDAQYLRALIWLNFDPAGLSCEEVVDVDAAVRRWAWRVVLQCERPADPEAMAIRIPENRLVPVRSAPPGRDTRYVRGCQVRELLAALGALPTDCGAGSSRARWLADVCRALAEERAITDGES